MDFRRLAITGLLLVVLAWGVYSSPLTKRLFQKKAPGVPARAGTQAGGLGAPLQAQAPSVREEVPGLPGAELAAWRQSYAEVWRRDPFFTFEEEEALRTPKVVKAPPPPAPPPLPPLPAYTVKAVLISESFKIATIDGRQVSEGEMLGDERVVEIQPDGVILERAGQRRRVEIVGGSVPLIEVGPRPERRGENR